MTSSHQSNEQLNSKDLEYNYENEDYAEEGDNPSGINLTKLNNEYDEYIAELKKQLSMAKELRKKSEVDSKTMEHRLNLLQDQEKYVMNQFLTTKRKIEKILINRTNAEVNHNSYAKLISKRKMGHNRRISYEFNNKKLMSSNGSCGSGSNCYNDEGKCNVVYSANEEAKSYSNANPNESKGMSNDQMIMMMNKENLQQIPEQSDDFDENNRRKQQIKQELLMKLQEDERERLRLENEIAIIEREELKILQLFNKDNKKDINLS